MDIDIIRGHLFNTMNRHFLLPLVLWMACVVVRAQQHYEIYPVPQQQEPVNGVARVTPRVAIVPESGIDKLTIARAVEVLEEHGCAVTVSKKPVKGKTNVLLGLQGSKGVADREARKRELSSAVFSLPKYDRHAVSLKADKKGNGQLLVLGENTDAVFCGLATIEQMLDRGLESLPCVNFYDYADTRTRGVIEGYYGVPYNAKVTKDLFRFMARYKMNTYMYGAKSDPYHTRYWGEPYPTAITKEQERIGYLTQDMLRDIVEVAHQSKVNFIWAIHPGTAFTNPESTDVIDRVMDKFESMYGLGVRQFGVFVDDVGVPTDDPTLRLNAQRLTDLQQAVDKRWNQSGKAPADTVKPLQFVPQLYAFSWVKPEVAQKFFSSLSSTPAKTDIYITGRNVWSVPNSEDLAMANSWLGRETAWWWNYPCNDNDVTKLFPMDTYTNFADEKHIDGRARMEATLTGTGTLIANPMQQGEASKIALFSIADYAWNHKSFDNQQSWLASLPAVVGKENAAALQRVVPYLRYYDKDALSALVDAYKQSVEQGTPHPEPLLKEIREVKAACRQLDKLARPSNESYSLFYEDIRPWVAKLDMMLTMTEMLLVDTKVDVEHDLEGDPKFQFEILSGLGEDIKLSVQTAEPSAQVLRPFIDWLKSQR